MQFKPILFKGWLYFPFFLLSSKSMYFDIPSHLFLLTFTFFTVSTLFFLSLFYNTFSFSAHLFLRIENYNMAKKM